MGDLKTELEAIFPQPANCPDYYKHGSIMELYKDYQKHLEGKTFTDPDGRRSSFRSEDFPHLVKLEFHDSKQKRWVNATAKATIPQLRAGTLDESKYRIGDPSRPRTLFWIPNILSRPDSVHPNRLNTRNDIYAKKFKRMGSGKTLKLVLVKTHYDGSRSVITSFWSNEHYHDKCIVRSKSK